MPVIREDSLHPIINLDQATDWSELRNICSEILPDTDFEKLKLFLSNSVRSILIEFEYNDKDYNDTFYNFYSKKFSYFDKQSVRLNFFSTSLKEEDIWQLDEELIASNYIGYTIIRPTKVNTIGRTILDPSKLNYPQGYLITTDFKVNILGSELVINGFPFISQDTDVSICAHAACWMVFRYFSQKHSDYAEILPYHLACLTNDYSYGRLFPSHGLTAEQILEIFSRYGLFPLIYERPTREVNPNISNEELESRDKRFYRIMHYYLESGIPLLIGVKQDRIRHAQVITGHRHNINEMNEYSGIINTADFYDRCIVCDDNFYPYQNIYRTERQHGYENSMFTLNNIEFFIVPFFEKVHLVAEKIEFLSYALLDRTSNINPFRYGLDENDLIARIYLVKSSLYKKHLKNNVRTNLSKSIRQFPMPKFIWVLELSNKQEFNNDKVIGEIVFDSTASKGDPLSYILFIHFPRIFVPDSRLRLFGVEDIEIVREGNGNIDPRNDIIEPDSQESYPAFRMNYKEVRL